jgi:FLVCR family MFS transporter
LGASSAIAFLQGWIWNTYGPIALAVKAQFGWDDATLSFLGNWGPIAYIAFFLPTAWSLARFKLRPTAIGAALLVCAGCGVRLIDTSESSTCLFLAHAGSCLNGLAGPFAMSAGTVVSAAWFGPDERTTSTAIFTIANMFGVSASYLVGPLLVPANGSVADIRRYLWICFILAAVSLLLVLVYLPSKPPTGSEPSRSASLERMSMCDGLRSLASHRNFWLVTLSYGATTGLYAGWGPLYAIIFEKLGPSICKDPQTTASWVGFWSNLGGNLAGMAFSVLADRGFGRKHFKTVLIVLSLLGAAVYGTFAILFARGSLTLTIVWVLCICGGIVVNGTVPIFYELAVDAAFPVAEGLTTSVLTVANNVGGLIFLLLPTLGLQIGNWVNLSVGGACVLSLVCMLLFQGNLNRSDEDSGSR